MSHDVQVGEITQPDMAPESRQDETPKRGAIHGVLRYGLVLVAAIAVIMTGGWVFWNQSATRNDVPKAGVDFVIPVYEPPAATQPVLATKADAATSVLESAKLDEDSEPAQISSAASATNDPDNGAITGASSEVLAVMAMPAADSAPSSQETDTSASGQAETLLSDLVAVVRGRETTLSESPAGAVVQYLPTGAPLTATGRSADGAWIYVQTFEGTSGWVDLDQIVIFNAGDLPVLDAEGDGAPAAMTESVDLSVDATPSTGEGVGSAIDQPSEAASVAGSQPGLRQDPVIQDGRLLATVALSDSRLNVRSGPGTRYAIIAKANPGESYAALARNDDGTWVGIELADDPDQIAWVSAEYITSTGPVHNLPVSDRAGGAPTATRAAAKVADGATGLSGNLAIQVGNGGQIFVYNLDSGSLRPLTNGYDPAISPDGLTVAFVRDGGESGIYLINTDGSGERRIFGERQGLRSPSWNPDGRSIVFVHARDSHKCREVGLGICLPDNNPFLDSFPVGSQPRTGLSQIDSNGDNYRDLPALPSAQAPDWGEGGIVYNSDKSIEITEAAPGGDTRYVVGKSFYQDPDWQPGGGQIAFQSREGTHWEIFVANPDGSGLTPLTKPQSVLVDVFPHNVAPIWSPDGRHVAYLSNRDDNNEAGDWRIWIMNADGSDQHPLPIDIPLDYNYSNEQMMSWGPPV